MYYNGHLNTSFYENFDHFNVHIIGRYTKEVAGATSSD